MGKVNRVRSYPRKPTWQISEQTRRIFNFIWFGIVFEEISDKRKSLGGGF
jgi:hypothetical protein